MSGARFVPVSPWAPAPERLAPRLDRALSTDVVIVGAGFTGLSTALALSEAGIDCVVLEQAHAGFGASGRNAGHLTPTIGKDLPSLLRFYGHARAGELLRFAEVAVRHVEERIDQLAIDCDYEPVGNIMAAVDDAQVPALRRAAEAGAQLGAQLRFLDRDGLAEAGLPETFLAGVLEPVGGVLHPGRYVRALRSEVLHRGIRLFERSAVQRIAQGPRLRVFTAGGVVAAPRMVLATNAWTNRLGFLRYRALPVSVSLFRTAPLRASALERIGWSGRQGIYTAHEILESYRLTADNRIVGGSKDIRYRYGSRLPEDDAPELFRFLERAFRERFPMLGDVPVESCWSGPISFTLDFLPVLGTTGRHDNIHYGACYAGHGVAQASYMGQLLCDQLCGRGERGTAISRRRVPLLPPEPLRWALYQLIRGLLAWLDARVDRRVRDRASRAG